MKIAILPSARDDLAEGFRFYDRQQQGLGDYFLDSLLSDIDSSDCMRAFTELSLVVTGCFQNDFLLPSIILTKREQYLSRRCSIAGVTREKICRS
jgi:hypothetical protein